MDEPCRTHFATTLLAHFGGHDNCSDYLSDADGSVGRAVGSSGIIPAYILAALLPDGKTLS